MPSAKRQAKLVLRQLFELGQRAGVDLLPRHFCSGIPDIHALRNSQAWRKPMGMAGIAGTDIDAQREALAGWCGDPALGCADVGLYARAVAHNGVEGFGPIEAQALFGFVQKERPKRVVQIGCGVSTAVIREAAARAGIDVEITCVDPFPTEFLRSAEREGAIILREEPAQGTPFEIFDALAAGDLLFVDSTHTVSPGSEVNRIILEILPRLARGVWVHFHDITFPYDYSRDLLAGGLFFPGETTLLHAFLAMNDRYRICVSLSMLHYAAPEHLRALFPNYRQCPNDDGLSAGDGDYPSSVYLRG